MDLTIKNRIQSSVAIVQCGATTGTAFFISEDTLLTAFHNISEFLVDQNVEVGIYVEDLFLPCTAEPLGKPGERIDVAILKISNPSEPKKMGLNLLSQTLNSDMLLHTCGYPKELGEATYPFPLPLKHIETLQKSDVDLILVKTSDVSFLSYEGYSGSPVVNTSGSVVGIIALQENQNLRALSIKKITSNLRLKGIEVCENGAFEDDSPTGLGACYKRLNQCLRQSPQKFNKDLHQPHTELESYIRRFFDAESIKKRTAVWREIQSWVGNHKTSFNGTNVTYKPKENLPEIVFLEDIYYRPYDEREKLSKSQKDLLAEARGLLNEYRSIENRKNFFSKRIFGIFGSAGVGKSHMTFYFSDQLLSEYNYVYYINGANINSHDDIVAQVKRFLGLSDEQLLQVDDFAQKKQKNVIIVIDAINEGAGYRFWKSALTTLLGFLREYETFKLLLSGRRSNTGIFKILEEELSEDSFSYELYGFDDVDKALTEYCRYYNINPSYIPAHITDFSNPLFLSIFCLAYRNYKPENGQPLSRLGIFSTYLTDRNESISVMTDEDPNRNITLRAVRKLAEYSVFYNNCDNVQRSAAHKICNRITYRRDWSKCLLKHLISENILFEINDYRPYEDQLLDFEFQNFGDVFRADAILQRPNSSSHIINSLISRINMGIENDNLINCLVEVFGAWDSEEDPSPYINKLPDRLLNGILIHKNEKVNAVISNRIISNFDRMRIKDFFEQSIYLPNGALWAYHSYLIGMPMNLRDLRYIREVNQRYDILGKSLLNTEDESNVDETIALRQLIYWGWSCSTSYPDYKSILVRNMCRTLVIYPHFCLTLAEAFHSVEDDYVREAVYCAIYGTLLITRKSEVAVEVAKSIINSFYVKGRPYPRNLLVRQWTMQIIELARNLSGEKELEMPNFKDGVISDNPLTWNLSGITYRLLGDTPGGKRLQYNVSSEGPIPSDFNRYIIGTNSSRVNRHFITKDDELIDLDSIEKMLIKEVLNLGWNDELGNIDLYASPFERYDNTKEKIGKKYLWIAYQNVMALLSDSCKFVVDRVYTYETVNPDKCLQHVFPWMVEGASRFDPTLNVLKDPKEDIPSLKFKSEIDNLSGLFDSNDFAKPILSALDVNEQTWLQVDGWDNWRVKTDDYRGSSAHIQYISWIIKGISTSDIIHLIKSKYERFEPDMPIDSAYDCIWNEFPWSERTFPYKYEWKEFIDGHGLIMPLRICQLQEDMGGIEYEQRPMNNAMLPNWDFMETMGLYTAERGIVRDRETNSIVSYNRENVEISCAGLIVRKDYIDRYLEKIEGHLLIQVEYYKCNSQESAREFEWFVYDKDSNPTSIIRFKQAFR